MYIVRDRLASFAKSRNCSIYFRCLLLSRPIHIGPEGRIFVHFTKKKQGDFVLGKGFYKTVKMAVLLGKGQEFASASSKGEVNVALAIREACIQREFHRFEGFVRCFGLVTYQDKRDGVDKCRMISEYCSGGTLHKAIRDELLTLKDRKRIFRGLIRAVAKMHELGYLHRDLTGANIFLKKIEGSFYPRIGDFGAACGVDEDEQRFNYLTSPFSVSPELAQALLDSDPEQIKDATTVQLDSWSLGCVLFQLWTGEFVSWTEYYDKDNEDPFFKVVASFHQETWLIPLKNTASSEANLIWQLLVERITAQEAFEVIQKLDSNADSRT